MLAFVHGGLCFSQVFYEEHLDTYHEYLLIGSLEVRPVVVLVG